ncbi:MAG: hypothetical protein IKK75_01975 [Clostridia bacterium]|nr:hypothetical protein [Clostridia bacterium]
MRSELDELVRVVTDRVLAAMNGQTITDDPRNAGKKKCLVLGGEANIPEAFVQDMILLDEKDYESIQNILRYDRVLITRMTLRQLADIAAGRPGDSLSCAVCQALLQGVDVLMLETAAPHRAHAGKGSTAFYRMLEGYMNTLQVFGIKMANKDSALAYVPEKPAGETVRCEVSDTRLITEEIALRLSQKAQEIVVPAGVIITPAAVDVLKEARVTIIRR